MIFTARKGCAAGTVVVLLLILLLLPSCGRKAKPEPKWGGSGTFLPSHASDAVSVPGNAEG